MEVKIVHGFEPNILTKGEIEEIIYNIAYKRAFKLVDIVETIRGTKLYRWKEIDPSPYKDLKEEVEVNE